MRTVLAYLKPHRRYMCLSLTIKVLGTMVELALPYILSHIIQDVITPRYRPILRRAAAA